MPASVEQISAEVFHLRIDNHAACKCYSTNGSTGGYAMNLTSTPALAQSSDGITKPPDILPNSIDVFGGYMAGTTPCHIQCFHYAQTSLDPLYPLEP